MSDAAAAPTSFVHRCEPSTAGSKRTLLLLHGTGGDENDLISLGRALDPDAALLSPRGQVLEHGMPRFFRRIREGVFDVPDLERRTDELAAFVREATRAYGLDPASNVAVGFSNGANIAASLLLRHGGLLAGAILFRAMLPYDPAPPQGLGSTRVFVSNGRRDPIAPIEQAERLVELLRAAGADVTTRWDDGGHGIGEAEVAAAGEWLRSAAS